VLVVASEKDIYFVVCVTIYILWHVIAT